MKICLEKTAYTWLQIEKSNPHRSIVALAGLTGILSCLDDQIGVETDWDTHLSVTNDLFGQYIYYRPADLYAVLSTEYNQRILPRIKNKVPYAADIINSVLEFFVDAIDFISERPVFPVAFSINLRRVFIANYYDFYERFKLFLHKKIPELINSCG